MLGAIGAGLATVRRSWGLAVLLWAVNLGLAALLALPLARILERALHETEAATNMMYAFDYAWWSQWSHQRSGWTASFAPDIFGRGLVFRNLDLLLKGNLPARLFVRPDPEAPRPARGFEAAPAVDGVILGLGLAYLVLQTFLAGGLLGVFRAPPASWTVRGLLHGSGFYFGRFLRLLAISLLALGVLFRLNAPLARFVDQLARESVSETGALAWSLGRHALLLLAILFLHMVACYARVIVAVEERSSALLAYLSALAFSMRNLPRTAGHYLVFVLMGLLLLAAWSAADARWDTIGYRTQVVTLVLAQGLVLGRIGLRLSLLAGQVALYRKLSS